MPSPGPRSSDPPDVIDGPRLGVPLPRGAQDCGLYVDGIRDAGRLTYADGLSRVRELGRGFIWLHLHEPPAGELQGIADALDLHRLAVEGALNPRRRPSFERYDGGVVLVAKTLAYRDDDPSARTRERLAVGQLTVVVGRDFVLSVGHGQHTRTADVRRHVDSSPTAAELGPDPVLAAFAEHVVGGYLDVSRLVEAELDAIEQAVFSPAASADIEFLYRVRRDLIHMRRAVGPLTPALCAVAEGYDDVVSVDVRRSLRDVMRHNAEITERLDNDVEALASLLESAYGLEATQQNVDMRKISAWAALAAIPTTVSGIYGMRFVDIPETHWAWGYPTVLAAMALTTVCLHRVFHRKGWL